MKNYADLGGEYLEHYGVKGMKWRKRSRVPLGDESDKRWRIRKHAANAASADPFTTYKRIQSSKKLNDETKKKNRRLYMRHQGKKIARTTTNNFLNKFKAISYGQKKQKVKNVGNKILGKKG